MSDAVVSTGLDEATELVEELARINPTSHRLAQYCCLAITIDRAYLRRTRMRFLPSSDPSAEVDLWLSEVVERRGHDRISLDVDVRTVLARQLLTLGSGTYRRVWRHLETETNESRRAVPSALLVGERLFYLSFLDDDWARRDEQEVFQLMLDVLAERDHDESSVVWAEGVLARLDPHQREQALEVSTVVERHLVEIYPATTARAVEAGAEEISTVADLADATTDKSRATELDAEAAEPNGGARVRRLTDDEIAAYDVLPEELARRVRIVRGWVPSGYQGMALGRSIYVKRAIPTDGNSRLLAHELVHVRQWSELGAVGFPLRYLTDFLRGLVQTRRWNAAYRSLPLEREARQVAEEWRRRRSAGNARQVRRAPVYVSYDRRDAAYVEELADVLRRDDLNLNLWLDRDRLSPGDQWQEVVTEVIESSSAVLVVMTDEAERSEWVQYEIAEAGRQEKPIFPLLLRGSGFPSLSGLAFYDVRDGSPPGPELIAALRREL